MLPIGFHWSPEVPTVPKIPMVSIGFHSILQGLSFGIGLNHLADRSASSDMGKHGKSLEISGLLVHKSWSRVSSSRRSQVSSTTSKIAIILQIDLAIEHDRSPSASTFNVHFLRIFELCS